MALTIDVTLLHFILKSCILLSTMFVVPDSIFPEGDDFIHGGQDDQIILPSLDPTSNFTRFFPPNATDTPEDLFIPVLSSASIQAPRFTR